MLYNSLDWQADTRKGEHSGMCQSSVEQLNNSAIGYRCHTPSSASALDGSVRISGFLFLLEQGLISKGEISFTNPFLQVATGAKV